MAWCAAGQCDNIGIMPFRLPDNSTYIYATDEADTLLFNPDTLATGGFHPWEDGDYLNPATGATHFKHDINTSDAIGLLTEMDMNPASEHKYIHTFYRVKADDVKNRIRIGSVYT